MADFQHLAQAQPERYAAAARTWRQWADKLDEGGDDVRKRIVDGVFAGDVWDDKAADVGRDYMEGLLRGIGTSYDDLDAVAAALSTAAREIGDAQHQVTQNVNRALDGGLEVDARGRVSVPDVAWGQGTGRTEDAAEALSGRLAQLARDCQRGIDQAVDDATQADRACASKLHELGSPIPTIQELNASSDRMGQRAKDAAAEAKQLLAGGVANLSEEELQRLQGLLRHADDPAFSTPFLQALGPRGALRFNVLLAEAGNSGMAGFDGLGEALQEDLAQALASATDDTAGQHLSYEPRTPEEKANDTSWIEELKQAGRTGLGSMGREGSSDLHGISGYHSLAALLDDADFSSGFLNEVGRDMYRFDVTENPDDWRRPAALSGDFDLDLGDPNESGMDPMSGLMQGLTNNPEAAREFFAHDFNDLDDPAARSPVDYLLTERDWGDGPDIPGTSNLGDALAAATTDVRNEQAAQIMGEAVHHLGSDPHAEMPANMRDSFGHMIGTWIDDVNHSVGGWAGDRAGDGWTIPVDLEEIPGDQPHAYFRSEEILEVMGEAAKDPQAYQEMWDHQRAYTAMALDQAAAHGTEGDFNSKAMTSGQVFGALSEANAQAAKEIAQESVANVETAQVVSNFGIGAAAAGAGTFVGGPAGAAAGSLVAQGGTFAVNEFVEEMKHYATASDYAAIERMYGDSERAVQDLVEDSIWRNEMTGEVSETISRPDSPEESREVFKYPNEDPVRLVGDSGRPVPYADMDEHQQRAYNTWMENHGPSNELKQEISQSIGKGRQDMRNASILGPYTQG